MECERLTKLIKNWYIQVKDEALAPARMADFMRSHLTSCPICMNDSEVESEVNKIVEIIMPPAKVTKTGSRGDQSDSGKGDASEESGEEQDEEAAHSGDDMEEGDGDEDEDIDDLEDEDDDI